MGEQPASIQIVQIATVLTALSIAPALLIMVTSFTRFVVSLSFLRAAFGVQGVPANMTIIALALVLTTHVMGPEVRTAWETGGLPYAQQKIDEATALEAITNPFRDFMKRHTRKADLELFSGLQEGQDRDNISVLVPAFMISELKRGFEIGILITLPFLVIDLLVALIAMSVGLMMMPPSVVSTPMKIMFFVAIDGWNLLASSLVGSVLGSAT